MHTLREVVDFTGVAGLAGQRPGERARPISLRTSGDLVGAVLGADERHSLRTLCALLPTMPPIALAVQVFGHVDEVAPSRPLISVDPPSGAVLETAVNFFAGGVAQEPDSSALRFIDGQQIDGTLFASAVFTVPGSYEAVVRRTGVTSTGVTVLERRATFRVRAVPPPPPPPPPPTPSPGPGPAPGPSVRPTCGVEPDPGSPVSSGFTGVRVFGSGFLAGDTLGVLVDGAAGTTTQVRAGGSYAVSLSVLVAAAPVTHRFQAVSSSGQTSNEATLTV